MRVRVETVLRASSAHLWSLLRYPASLLHVCRPVLHFTFAHPAEAELPWKAGVPYRLKMYLFGFIPLGAHTLSLDVLDEQRRTIVSRETGTLAKVWNHTISLWDEGQGEVRYVDEIEIRAGLLTLPIVAFAHVFYRHRQRRWKQLLRSRAALNDLSR